MKLKTNLDKIAAPVMEYKLPSGGLAYTQPFPATIQISPYGFTTESILVSNLTSTEKMMGVVKDICTLPDGFQPEKLLLSDQYFILAVARALTYGMDYTFFSTCPSCEFEEKHVLKVPDQLPIRLWTNNKDEVKDGVIHINDLSRKLPVSGDVVEFRFLTVEDNANALKYAEEKKKIANSAQDQAYLRRIAMHLKSINGVEVTPADWRELEENYIKRIRGADHVAIKDAMEELNCGFIQNWKILCENEKCRKAYTTYIPITNNFFRRD